MNTTATIGEILLVQRVLLEGVNGSLSSGLRLWALRCSVAFEKTLCLFFSGLASLFVLFQLCRQLRAADCELLLLLVRLIQCRLQHSLLFAQRLPGAEHVEESVFLEVLFVWVDG